MFGITTGRMLVASLLLGLVGVGGLFGLSSDNGAVADMRITESTNTLAIGDTFTIDIVVDASEPMNVFKGMLIFDPAALTIQSIDYNTSLADLWAEEPWYSNGEGTLNFIGGTTRLGGFVGTEKILTVTFETQSVGMTTLTLKEIKILRHDALGSEAQMNKRSDTIFTIQERLSQSEVIIDPTNKTGQSLQVLPTNINTDLNNDGKQSIADISIFMSHLATQNLRSDFNEDGRVNLQDLSILNR